MLVEQYGLTHGSTWHSAGLVGQLRSTVSLTKMMQYSVGLYADLARETGKDPGWHELGGLRLASSQERYEEIQRQAGWAKSFGLPIEIVSPAEAKELFPPMSTDGVVAAAFLPQDGYLDPSQLTFALADGARLLRRRDRAAHARARRDRRGRPLPGRRHRQGHDPRRRGRERRRHVRARRSAGWPASRCRSSRTRTSSW